MRTSKAPSHTFLSLHFLLFCRERGQRALEERMKAKTGAALKPVTDVEAVAV